MRRPRVAQTQRLTYECIERLEAWVRAHCPCAFDDPQREFLRGLMFICEDEVHGALERERARLMNDLHNPSLQ